MFNIGFKNASLHVVHLIPHDVFLSFLERKISKKLFSGSVEKDGLPGLEDAIEDFAPDIIERVQARSVETSEASSFNRAPTNPDSIGVPGIQIEKPSLPLNTRAARGFWKLLRWRQRRR